MRSTAGTFFGGGHGHRGAIVAEATPDALSGVGGPPLLVVPAPLLVDVLVGMIAQRLACACLPRGFFHRTNHQRPEACAGPKP